ncbi:MAG: RluA family pseudouridine synthase [Planctomycetota bacterium]
MTETSPAHADDFERWQKSWTVEAPDRLDRFIAHHLPVSRRVLRTWIEQERVLVNDRPAPKGRHLIPEDRVRIVLPGDPERPLVAESKRPVVLAQTEEWVAIDKPPGLPSHPKLPFETGTALTQMLAIDPEIGLTGDDSLQGGLVHRLDPGTSGVLIAARNRESWDRLRRLFSSGKIDKLYLARIRLPAGREVPLVIDRPLAPFRGDDTRVAWNSREMASSARQVRTECRILRDRWVMVRIRTGHRHQIRAHLASFGLPIDGDETYGGNKASRLFLHAWALDMPGHGWVVSPPPETWRLPEPLDPDQAQRRLNTRPAPARSRNSRGGNGTGFGGRSGPSGPGGRGRRPSGNTKPGGRPQGGQGGARPGGGNSRPGGSRPGGRSGNSGGSKPPAGPRRGPERDRR